MQVENNAGSAVPQDAGIEVETNLPQDIAPQEAAEAQEVEDDDDAEDPNESGDEAPERKKNRRARQIDRLRIDNANKDRLIAELMGKVPNQEVKKDVVQQVSTDKEPLIGEFTDVLDYLQKHNDWKIQQSLKAFQDGQKQQAQTQEQERVYHEKVSKYNEKLQTVLKEIPDFPDRIQALMDAGLVTKSVEDAVLDSDASDLVSLYLVANPQELQAMQGMNEKQIYKAIGVIEARVSKETQSPDQQTGKKTSASAPINPIGKKAATSTKNPAESDDINDWYAYEAKLKAPLR